MPHGPKLDVSLDAPVLTEAMTQAIRTAREGRTAYGAAVVYDSEILLVRRNEVDQRRDPTAHAEIVAIRALYSDHTAVDPRACVLVSTAEPCPMCMTACVWARIGAVVFGAQIRDIERVSDQVTIDAEIVVNASFHRPRLKRGFMREQALALF